MFLEILIPARVEKQQLMQIHFMENDDGCRKWRFSLNRTWV